MDSFDVAFAERPVLTAGKPRADRTARSGIAALRSARLAAAARRASRKLYHLSPASAARRGSILVWFSRFHCATRQAAPCRSAPLVGLLADGHLYPYHG